MMNKQEMVRRVREAIEHHPESEAMFNGLITLMAHTFGNPMIFAMCVASMGEEVGDVKTLHDNLAPVIKEISQEILAEIKGDSELKSQWDEFVKNAHNN